MIRRLMSAMLSKTTGTITSVSTSEPVVALTFDDGPNPDSTVKYLEILETYKAKATFFMVGKSARQYPELVEKVAQAGHSIGNHSWGHAPYDLMDSSRLRRRDILACQDALAGYGSKIFRPPYGHQSLASRLDAFLLGYKVVTWSVESQDWTGSDAQEIADRVIEKIVPGSIILFHDCLYTVTEQGLEAREQSLKAVNMILNVLCGKFRFVTVEQLLSCGRPIRKNWYRKQDQQWFDNLKVVTR